MKSQVSWFSALRLGRRLLLTTALVVELHSVAFGQAIDPSIPEPPPPPEAVPEEGLKTVKVTAQRHETNLQETPAAITAFSPAALEQQGISDPRDISGRVPSLTEPKRSTSYSTQLYSIRGIGEIDTFPEPAVGLYIDDVYLPRTVGSMRDIPNLENIEILRGPQGTLYGRNTSAGLIRFVTSDPTNTVQGWTQFTVGNYGDFENQSVISGPLIDGKLTASLAYTHRQRDGWTHDVTLNEDVNNIDLNVARLKLKFTPTDALSIVLAIDGDQDSSSASYYTPINQPNGTPSGSRNLNLTWASVPPLDKVQDGGIALTVAYKLDPAWTVKSITSVRAFHGPYFYDNGGQSTYLGLSYAGFQDHDRTEELQLLGSFDRLNLIGGFYYFNEYFANNRINETTVGAVPNVGILSIADSLYKTNSDAIYAQGDYKVLDDLTITLGGRFTYDHHQFYDQGASATNARLAVPIPTPVYSLLPANAVYFNTVAEGHWTAFTPKTGLQYQVTPDAMLYATYSQGFKSGGFDLRATDALDATKSFLPETNDAYEIGAKAELFDHTLRTNLALFYNAITDLQLRVVDPSTNTQRRINAGEAHTEGVEFETTYQPIHDLTLTNNWGYLWAAYDTFTGKVPANPGGVTTLIGRKFPLAPRFTFSSAASYQLPWAVYGVWRLNGDVEFQSRTWGDVINTPQDEIPTQYFANLSLSYESGDGHWSSTVAVKNLFDRQYNQAGGYTPAAFGSYAPNGTSYYAPNPPRMVTVSARYTF